MTRMRYVNKEKIVCIAAATLLAITAHAIIAGALRQKPLPGRPTVGGVRLRKAGELEVGPKHFAGFWNFGERNPFQPVIDFPFQVNPTDSFSGISRTGWVSILLFFISNSSSRSDG